MNVIDFILNLACLLMWLNWRALRFERLERPAPVSLAGTLRRAETKRLEGWPLLAGVAGLLLLRSVIYAQIGPAANWTPRIDCGAVSLAFRTDSRLLEGFTDMLLYSVLSFARVIVVFYFWLLALTVIHRPASEGEPLHRLVRLHLGWAATWPAWVQIPFPLVSLTAMWVLLYPALVRTGSLSPAQSFLHIVEQGAIVGAGIYLTLKYLVPLILLLYLVASYVYLGSSPVWDYINAVASRIILPLQRLPFRVGRVDFTPVIAAVIVLLLLEALPKILLEKYAGFRGTLWPQ